MTRSIPRLTRRALLGSALAATLIPAARRVAAATGAASELRFLVIGDWGRQGSPGQRSVAIAMAEAARRLAPRFVISVGDNFYRNGVTSTADAQWQSSFAAVYADPALDCPWYPVLGNHDHKGNISAEIEYSKLDRRWRMPARYYRRTEPLPGGGEADFFFLDTTEFVERLPWLGDHDVQLAWLERGVRDSQAAWKIVVGHHPIYSGGRHGGSLALYEKVKPLLDRFGVAAYLNGHDHDMEHVEENGVHYLTCGTGAEAKPSRRLHATRFVASRLGFLTAALSAAAMEVAFVDDHGATLYRAAIPARA